MIDVASLIQQFFYKFIHYAVSILPYFFIATVFGALIQSYLSFNFIRKFVNKRFLSPIITAIFGSSAPVCSCSMIPIAQTINSLSKSYAPAIAFLITAPTLSPVIFFLMVGLFGWKLTIFRFVFAFLVALIVAYIVEFTFKKPPSLPFFSGRSQVSRWDAFKNAFKEIFIDTGKYVLIGLFIAALVSVLIPPTIVEKFASFPLSYLFIAAVSIPIYVCSGEEIPIAKSFMDLGLTPGQALTFMLASAGICIPTISATFKFFPKPLALLYVAVWFVGSVIGGVLYDLLF